MTAIIGLASGPPFAAAIKLLIISLKAYLDKEALLKIKFPDEGVIIPSIA